jgi:serine/threonine protein kinase
VNPHPVIQGALEVPLTDHGKILGTPAYMAPEQSAGEIAKMNERTDVYALGAILYFLLTDVAPFPQTDSMTKTVDSQKFLAPRRRNSKISRSLEAVCLKAMAYLQEDRYANALELANDVGRYLDGLSVIAYRENPLETIQRWVSRNYFVVLLVVSYLLMRILILILTGR